MVLILLFQLTSISISPGRDQLVVFHSPRQNDLVISLQKENAQLGDEDRIGEIVARVCKRYKE